MPDDIASLFTAPLPGQPPTRERAGLSTAPDTVNLPRATGKVNATTGQELPGRVLGNVPFPRNDDGVTGVRLVLGRTISGCPAELLDAWLAGDGTASGSFPATIAVTDFKTRRVGSAALVEEAGRIAELFKRGK